MRENKSDLVEWNELYLYMINVRAFSKEDDVKYKCCYFKRIDIGHIYVCNKKVKNI